MWEANKQSAGERHIVLTRSVAAAVAHTGNRQCLYIETGVGNDGGRIVGRPPQAAGRGGSVQPDTYDQNDNDSGGGGSGESISDGGSISDRYGEIYNSFEFEPLFRPLLYSPHARDRRVQ